MKRNDLPKWAQSQIEHQENEIAELKSQIRIMLGLDKSKIYFTRWDGETFWIPSSVVNFNLGQGRRDLISVCLDNTGIEIMAPVQEINIRPKTSNRCGIYLWNE